MSGTNTAEQIKLNRIKVLGNDFGKLYNSLYNEVVWINFKWLEYKELFGKKESRVEMLNKTAPFLFFVIQKTLWENILLGIARITDPAKMYGKSNVTIKALPDFIADESFKEKIKEKIESINSKSNFCRDWRNRWIAHKDLLLSINENAEPLSHASRKQVDESLEMIFELINKIEDKYFKSTTMFKLLSSDNRKGAISLLCIIDDGLDSRKELLERLKSGNFDSNDLKNYEI